MELTIGIATGAIFTTAVGWIVAHLMPGLWARLTNASDLHVHIERDPSIIYSGLPDWVPSTWVLPADVLIAQMGAPPDLGCREWRAWLWSTGAYDGHMTRRADHPSGQLEYDCPGGRASHHGD